MKRFFPAALSALLLCSLTISCAEEQANDRPDLSAETKRGEGRVLEELVEIVPIPADAPRAPLVDGLESLMTFDEAFEVVKEKPHFISYASRIEARGVCPGLTTRHLEVDPWVDLRMPGKLTLTFYNDVLGAAQFGVGDRETYKARAAAERDAGIRTVSRNKVGPWVEVWAPVLPPHAPTYSDLRVAEWQDLINKACRYQSQIEAGESPPISE